MTSGGVRGRDRTDDRSGGSPSSLEARAPDSPQKLRVQHQPDNPQKIRALQHQADNPQKSPDLGGPSGHPAVLPLLSRGPTTVESSPLPQRPAATRAGVAPSSTYASLRTGVVAWSPAATRQRCVVFFHRWSVWKPVLLALNLELIREIELRTATSEIKIEEGTLIFVTGPWELAEIVWATFGPTHRLWVFLDLGSRPNFAVGSWKKAEHAHFYGVTDGAWWWGTSSQLPTREAVATSARRLLHILSPLQKGRPFTPIHEPSEGYYDSVEWVQGFCHPKGLFPARKPQALVLAPSVFTRWTTRYLTPKELMECWDIPPDYQKDYSALQPKTFNEAPFLMTAPAKVLHGILSLFTDSLLTDSTMYAPPDVLGDSTSGSGELSRAPVPDNSLGDTASGHTQSCFVLGSGGDPMRERAAKNDDAEVPTHLWDGPFWQHLTDMGRSLRFIHRAQQLSLGPRKQGVLELLRQFILRLWRRSVYMNFRAYMRMEHGARWHLLLSSDREAGVDCLTRAAASTFWEWAGGSRLFFWRWPAPIRTWARDGHPVYVSGELPSYTKKQPWEPNVTTRRQVAAKLEKFVERQYVSKGSVRSLVSFFTVPKGDSDVRVVFDGTRSGLNAALWAPSFHLPTIDSLLPSLEPGYWQSDIDVGEQFYNYRLDPRIQPYCGLDVTHYLPHKPGKLLWYCWNRCVMGLMSSPHGCVKMQTLGEEFVRGDPRSPANPFFYDQVRLNLPGSADYDPRLAKVSKLDSRTGCTAGDIATYVDDTRTTGATAAHCWAVSHQVGTRLCYLGIQDALRKRTAPSQRAGAWTGSLAHSPPSAIIVSCTQEKWTHARTYLLEIQSVVRQGLPFLHKDLEQKRGFLVYITRTYPAFTPFLKGIHLTLDSWRAGRDNDGWRDHTQILNHLDADLQPPSANAPLHVMGVPRLADDVESLLHLMSSPTPPDRVVRSSSIMVAFYGFGDASGAGFGSTILGPNGVHYRYGVWGSDLEGASSNYCELLNLTEAAAAHLDSLSFSNLERLVDGVASEATTSPLAGCEFYLFTDNLVAESAFFKGTSSNPRLFALILRLKRLEIDHSFTLHLVHIAGRRMITQGTDGLSRGDLLQGVMRGQSMMTFVPLHLSAAERSPALLSWVQDWVTPGWTVQPLQPIDWFALGHGLTAWRPNLDGLPCPVSDVPFQTVMLWTPPPAAASTAVEQLSFSRMKRPHLAHVFVVPRLMTHLWRKQLFKLADLVFTLPVAFQPAVWPHDMFEPLIVGILLPFLPHSPWSRRHTPSVLEVGRSLSGVFSALSGDECAILRKLWYEPGGGGLKFVRELGAVLVTLRTTWISFMSTYQSTKMVLLGLSMRRISCVFGRQGTAIT